MRLPLGIYSTAFGKWGDGTARLDGAIAIGSEEGRWTVVEEVFPEQSGARDTLLGDDLLDHSPAPFLATDCYGPVKSSRAVTPCPCQMLWSTW